MTTDANGVRRHRAGPFIAKPVLRDNKRYAVVWEVLQALRAHDERFDALVNRISLSAARDPKVNVIGVGDGWDGWEQGQLDLDYPGLDQWRDAIYARIVHKVGSREYWTDWAKDVAGIAERQITRITALLSDQRTASVREEFESFLHGLRGNLNESITERDAIEMLAQHLITRPVFNALFDGDEFLDSNPVAQTMERMLAVLDQHDLEAENESLHKFYESVRRKVADVKDREGRQELVRRLYDTFFATAFKRTSEKLGIVYTPTPLVDFILRSADEVLKKEFGQRLSDPGVHVLDGFTGTGTFMVRLLELGLIDRHDLARKYTRELHANEILLLAYYIAAVNIETTYLGIRREEQVDAEYESFPGLILADTFQSWEPDDRLDLSVFPENNQRLEELKELKITVIVGNPPYSVGQESANDANQNEIYPALDHEIRKTYAERSSSALVRNMYDSYIRAIKWASLRIDERGLIAYVTNGGFIDSNNADGMRKALTDEFTAIYVFNLRGNQRTAGELSRKEGGKIFGGGSRATVAITVLVKNPERNSGLADIHYTDVGDYLTREQKLEKVADFASVFDLPSTLISPNDAGDWLNQRSGDFARFLPLRDDGAVFATTTLGVSTNRDAWMLNSSKDAVAASVGHLVDAFNEGLAGGKSHDEIGSKDVAWSRGLRNRYDARRRLSEDAVGIVESTYRPFFKQWLATLTPLLEAKGSTLEMFNVPEQIAMTVLRPNDRTPFSILMINVPPNLGYFMDPGQVFPRWVPSPAGSLFEGEGQVVSNVTDATLERVRNAYNNGQITKDDIFFYVYGLLHSPDYRAAYSADLKKMLPRIPLAERFSEFVDAGRRLSDLHVNYESVDCYPLDGLDVSPPAGVDPFAFFAVGDRKMRFGDIGKTVLNYNSRVTLSGIPEDAHRYILGSRSAIEWLVDRYYVKTHSESGLVNDPNDWSREVSDPRYIVDLFARVTTVSLRTMKIVDSLPL